MTTYQDEGLFAFPEFREANDRLRPRAPGHDLLALEHRWRLRAFVLWARRGVVVQGGRLSDHLNFDGVSEAIGIILDAERLGWIRRAKWEPTTEQRGHCDPPMHIREQMPETRRPSEYAWEVQVCAPLYTADIEVPKLTPEAAVQLKELETYWTEWTQREHEEARCAAGDWALAVAKRVAAAAAEVGTVEPRKGIRRTIRAKSRKS